MPDSPSPREEIRFAVVLNGGVSLAVWMGGAAHELNELTWEREARSPYTKVLGLLGATAQVDVIAGTSAGGINGAALAIAQANKLADLTRLRELWSEQGRMDSLLRPPFQGQPPSLLSGEYFHRQLLAAMEQLAANFSTRSERPIDLTLATTLLTGAQDITRDSLGNALSDVRHDGRFRFCSDDFDVDQREATVPALALAARSSASFPVAFEPVFVPVAAGPQPVAAERPAATPPKDPLRPDMSRYAQWNDDPQATDADRSRYAVDGGVLANTPTEYALDAIAGMETGKLVRRVMLLVYPHAPGVAPEVAADAAKPPSVIEALRGVGEALASQGGRTFVAAIDEHNLNAEGWRDGRSAALHLLSDPRSSPRDLVRSFWPLFRRQRKRRAAARWAALAPAPQKWPAERIRRAVREAQDSKPDTALHYFPKQFDDRADGWAWDPEMALAVADAAADALRRALSVATPKEAVALERARLAVSEAHAVLRHKALEVEAAVMPPPLAKDAVPDKEYWLDRLVIFDATMDGPLGIVIGTEVDAVAEALKKVAGTFRDIRRDKERWNSAGLRNWDRLAYVPGVLGSGASWLTGQKWAGWGLLEWLLALEIVTTAASDRPRPSSTAPIDLVQISMAARGPLLGESRSGEDKLAGLSLGHFGGFLKRSWRVNDWIWGRLDAADVLMRTLLTEDAVRRLLTAEERPDDLVLRLSQALFGDGALPREILTLREAAVVCVRKLKAGTSSATDGLADLCVAARYLEIIDEELPLLAAAVEADRLDGARKGSNGEAFVALNAELIQRIQQGSTGRQPAAVLADRVAALGAFDRAGIGREPISEELGSDQLVRTTITAAATATTLLDSDALGTAVAKPVTKTLRGAMLLPYWVVFGLTRGGIPRFLALLGLVGGGVLLCLSLLGVLQGAIATFATLAGLGAVLFGFGYAALRSGSLIHGAVLFAPISPLIAVAVTKAATSKGDPVTLFGIFTIGAVLAVVASLILLASLPNPLRSPVGTAGVLARRLVGTGSRLFGVFRALAVIGTVAAAAWVAVLAARTPWPQLVATVPAWVWWVLLAVPFVVGGTVAYRGGRWLRRWRRSTSGKKKWALQVVSHRAGVSAGWSWVYGVVYAGIAWVAFVLYGPAAASAEAAAVRQAATPKTDAEVEAAKAAISLQDLPPALLGLGIGSVVLSLALLVAGPTVIPALARRSLSRSLAGDAVLVRRLNAETTQDDRFRAFVDTLVRRGATYRYLVEPDPTDGTRLVPSAAGRDLVDATRSGRRRPWSSVPVSAHVGVMAVAVGAVAAREWSPLAGVRGWVAAVGPIWLIVFGVALIVGLAVVEGRQLGRGQFRAAEHPALALALAGLVGLLAVAAGADQWGLLREQPDAATLAVVLTVVLAAGVGLFVVLYARRWFARWQHGSGGGSGA